VAGFLFALWLLARFLRYLRWRGMMPKAHYVDRAGSAMLNAQAMLEPSKRHVTKARERDDAEEDGAGGPETAGKR